MRYGFLLGALVLVPVLFLLAAQTGAVRPASVLPGARPPVNAALFESLQAALDALPPRGGVVEIPPGDFRISEPLRLNQGDVLIRGSGTATHIQNINTSGKPALIIEPPAGTQSLWRIEIKDLRITGNPKSGHGIVARKIDEFFLHGVTVSYHGGHGVFLDACYEDPRICDSLITYNKGSGLALRACHDIVVSGNQFEENLDAVTCIDSFNLCMSGNNLDDHLRHGVVIENTYGSIVTANMIEECNGFAVVLDRDCYGITISANVFAHKGVGGVDLRDAHGCAVSANTFTIVAGKALRIGPESGLVVVSGNSFSDSTIGPGVVKRKGNVATGIVFEGGEKVACTANAFTNLTTPAVRAEGGKEALFAGNLVSGCAPGWEELPSATKIGNLVIESRPKAAHTKTGK